MADQVWTDDWNPALNSRHPSVLIDPDGVHFKALVTPFNACIQDANAAPGVCLTPPRDGADYEYAHTGGDMALIPMGMGHADPKMTLSAASSLYANTDFAAAEARYSEDELGIWAEGSLLAGLTPRQLSIIRRGGLSGDWRWVEEEQRHRMIASQFVNTLGFRRANPQQRQFAMTASAAMAPGMQSTPNALFSMPDGVIAAAADEPDYANSIMVALVPDDASYSELDDPHLTLVYGGDATDEGAPDIEEIHATVAVLAAENEVVVARRSGAGELGEEGAHIMLLEHFALDSMRLELARYNRSDHPGFIAHSTIRYADADDPLPRARDLPEEVTFSNMLVAVGDDHTLYPLGKSSVMATLAAALAGNTSQMVAFDHADVSTVSPMSGCTCNSGDAPSELDDAVAQVIQASATATDEKFAALSARIDELVALLNPDGESADPITASPEDTADSRVREIENRLAQLEEAVSAMIVEATPEMAGIS